MIKYFSEFCINLYKWLRPSNSKGLAQCAMVMLSKFRTWSAASGRVIAGPAKSCIDPNDSGSNK